MGIRNVRNLVTRREEAVEARVILITEREVGDEAREIHFLGPFALPS